MIKNCIQQIAPEGGLAQRSTSHGRNDISQEYEPRSQQYRTLARGTEAKSGKQKMFLENRRFFWWDRLLLMKFLQERCWSQQIGGGKKNWQQFPTSSPAKEIWSHPPPEQLHQLPGDNSFSIVRLPSVYTNGFVFALLICTHPITTPIINTDFSPFTFAA